jgi:hypothetical protein
MSTTENPAGANGGAQNDSPTTECCETRRIYSQCQEASFKLEDAPPTAPEDGEQTPTALRLELKARGYSPIPLYGKEPPIYGVNNAHGGLAGWQKLRDIPVGKIEAWDRKWPDADNTGILTYCTPTFDIDMMHAAAADAVEALARERFGARGRILIRTGQAPKRAIPLRTETPFAKKKRVFTAPDGSEHKIEILCDGQQLVTRGIHPDTKQPYTWTGGEPWTVDRSELPEISEAAAIAFLNAASEFLIEQFGFKPKSDEKADTGDGGPSHDWEEPISNILSGVDLHDSIAVLAMKMIVSGMSPGAAVNMLRTLMKQSNVKGDDDNFTRYAERYDDIPRAVDTAVNKVGREEEKPASIKSKLMQSSAVFVGNYVPPDYLVDGLLQRRYVYSFTGPTGSGKTAIVLRLAARTLHAVCL